jgi:RNA polymerase sigma factor (sigma-70 family)
MVWGVCRRVLRNYHDAEDAFQATFLVLVRKAASISSRDLLVHWLYRVAYQTALKARATASRRGARERQVTEMPEPEVASGDHLHDLESLLDEELSHLPGRYRELIVLCDLGGKTRKEAARQLRCPEGTVAGRLARARLLLARRLARHGRTVSGAILAAGLGEGAASAFVLPSVVSSTVKAATLFLAGQGAASGVISARVAALAEGVLKAMLLKKLQVLVVLVLVVTVLVGGSGQLLPTHAGEKRRELTITLKTEQQKTRDEEFNKELLAMEARLWEGHQKCDARALEKIYADDYVAFSERGRSDKRANLAALTVVRTGKVTFRDVQVVRVTKDTAVVTYRADRTVLTPGGTLLFERLDCRISNTWVRRDGRWVIVFCQETQLPTGKAISQSP